MDKNEQESGNIDEPSRIANASLQVLEYPEVGQTGSFRSSLPKSAVLLTGPLSR